MVTIWITNGLIISFKKVKCLESKQTKLLPAFETMHQNIINKSKKTIRTYNLRT